MKKADIVVGEEYFAAQGTTYVYGEKRVKVEAVGAHKNSMRDAQWRAQTQLEYRSKVEGWKNDPDLSPNQVRANIAALDVEVEKLANRLYTPYRTDGKGGDVLCVLLDKKTGEPEKERVYDRSRGEYRETNQPQRILVSSREFRTTWKAHVKDIEENARYRREQQEKAEKREAQKVRELQALKAGLPEGMTFGGYPAEDVIAVDYRPYSSGKVEVALTRAQLAKLLGVTLPEPPKEETA